MTFPIDRRGVLKALGVTALLNLAPAELLAAARSLQAQIDGERHVFRSLDREQGELVAMISELIIPETETPGAGAARVDAFIDRVVTEWFTDDERRRFLEGLARLSAQGFRERPESEQKRVLESLERETVAEEARQTAGVTIEPASAADAPFFSVIKWLTLYGYFTSGVAMEPELDHVIFHGSYDGCAPLGR